MKLSAKANLNFHGRYTTRRDGPLKVFDADDSDSSSIFARQIQLVAHRNFGKDSCSINANFLFTIKKDTNNLDTDITIGCFAGKISACLQI